jgi:hypothetical protein
MAWRRDLYREDYKKIVRCCGEVIVRGTVLTPREPRRATLVERDTKSDKWSGRIKVLELVVSIHVEECDLRVTTSKSNGGNLRACLNGD